MDEMSTLRAETIAANDAAQEAGYQVGNEDEGSAAWALAIIAASHKAQVAAHAAQRLLDAIEASA